jgi:hypothetical protein
MKKNIPAISEEHLANLGKLMQEAIDNGQIAHGKSTNIRRLIEKGVIQKIEQMYAKEKQ